MRKTSEVLAERLSSNCIIDATSTALLGKEISVFLTAFMKQCKWLTLLFLHSWAHTFSVFGMTKREVHMNLLMDPANSLPWYQGPCTFIQTPATVGPWTQTWLLAAVLVLMTSWTLVAAQAHSGLHGHYSSLTLKVQHGFRCRPRLWASAGPQWRQEPYQLELHLSRATDMAPSSNSGPDGGTGLWHQHGTCGSTTLGHQFSHRWWLRL